MTQQNNHVVSNHLDHQNSKVLQEEVSLSLEPILPAKKYVTKNSAKKNVKKQANSGRRDNKDLRDSATRKGRKSVLLNKASLSKNIPSVPLVN